MFWLYRLNQGPSRCKACALTTGLHPRPFPGSEEGCLAFSDSKLGHFLLPEKSLCSQCSCHLELLNSFRRPKTPGFTFRGITRKTNSLAALSHSQGFSPSCSAMHLEGFVAAKSRVGKQENARSLDIQREAAVGEGHVCGGDRP